MGSVGLELWVVGCGVIGIQGSNQGQAETVRPTKGEREKVKREGTCVKNEHRDETQMPFSLQSKRRGEARGDVILLLLVAPPRLRASGRSRTRAREQAPDAREGLGDGDQGSWFRGSGRTAVRSGAWYTSKRWHSSSLKNTLMAARFNSPVTNASPSSGLHLNDDTTRDTSHLSRSTGLPLSAMAPSLGGLSCRGPCARARPLPKRKEVRFRLSFWENSPLLLFDLQSTASGLDFRKAFC